MSRDHLAFALFMLLLLVAPKVPLQISGGVADSSLSLGFAGLVLWLLAHPERLWHIPKISDAHPLFWLGTFALYAFLVSAISTKSVGIAYSLQYSFYIVIGSVLMVRYARDLHSNGWVACYSILIVVGVIYALGMFVSIGTGPIYQHSHSAAMRHWEGLMIQRGVGFSENTNAAGLVLVFFLAACMFLYWDKAWRKWLVLSLLLLAMLVTLSRTAIVSFGVALAFVYSLAMLEPLLHRVSIKRWLVRNAGHFLLVSCSLIVGLISAILLFKPSLVAALMAGFGVAQRSGIIERDVTDRFALWAWGIEVWASGTPLRMLFGGGFRSSMVAASYGAWLEPHNLYVTILGDFGIVGLCLFLTPFAVALFRYVSAFLRGREGPLERFGLFFLVGLMVMNMTAPFLYSPICLSLAVFTFALTFSSDRAEVRRQGYLGCESMTVSS